MNKLQHLNSIKPKHTSRFCFSDADYLVTQ